MDAWLVETELMVLVVLIIAIAAVVALLHDRRPR